MKAKIWMLVAAVLTAGVLVGCDASTTESTDSYILPKELAEKGCKIYYMEGKNASTLNVVYCPGATVTSEYRSGKQSRTVTTIDEGVDYGY
ncbi:hypothetical protein [Enterobacter phage vB_ExiM_F5M1E]|nr:hypothetical protein [Enterobacter phage vB_ExiM_F1M1E]UNA03034.1 hypothetical protein [Enterobacter phage vB_ExiM_F2M1E]UNA03355.1 hypothetical protein [Enterobacter phage vB_ExiM_F4M1E]UNA03676.1 hypothetical protein [Enterobacter phage vB_ExiM_F5M1E]UNA03996.1 hypothetical protein [Pantoea phage vB_PdiM_F5M2A]